MKKIQIALMTLVLMAGGAAHAQYGESGQMEIAPFFGVIFPDGYGAIDPSKGPIAGVRLGFYLSDSFGLELSGQRAFSEDAAGNQTIDLDGYRANLMWNIKTGVFIRPFLTAGGGWERFHSVPTGTQNDWGINGGGGFRFFIGDNAGVRLDGRYAAARVNLAGSNDWQKNIEANLGLFFLFGGQKEGPADADKDGVKDSLDQCANTPMGSRVGPDGCEIGLKDSDNDGVIDSNDKCPGTVAGTKVDGTGCEVENDDDKDGITNMDDKCPQTPANAPVDQTGCPTDTDADNVKDYMDKCPNTPAGTQVDEMGCPLESKARGVLKGVTFKTNSPELTDNANGVLDGVAAELKQFPEVKVEIQGHSDSVGDEGYNLSLSQKRAESVMNYLSTQGIPSEQMTAKGYGETAPIADNNTSDGRSKNRRVEMKWLE